MDCNDYQNVCLGSQVTDYIIDRLPQVPYPEFTMPIPEILLPKVCFQAVTRSGRAQKAPLLKDWAISVNRDSPTIASIWMSEVFPVRSLSFFILHQMIGSSLSFLSALNPIAFTQICLNSEGALLSFFLFILYYIKNCGNFSSTSVLRMNLNNFTISQS